MYSRIWGLILCGLMASSANASDIYKCISKNGVVSYGDAPCPGQRTDLLHKDTDADAAKAKQERISNAINGMLQSGRLEEAKSFAAANGAQALLQERIQAMHQREQAQHNKEVINEAEAQRERVAANQANIEQQQRRNRAVLEEQEAASDRYRAEHRRELQKEAVEDLKLGRGYHETYDPLKNKWCAISPVDGNQECH